MWCLASTSTNSGLTLGQVVAHARGDEGLLDARFLSDLAEELDERGVIGDEVLADARIYAAQASAGVLDALVLAFHLVHVRGRSADVADHAGKVVHAPQRTHFAEDALGASRLNHPALVLGDRAEAAAAETAAHGHDGVLDRLEGGDGRVVRRMWVAREREIVELVHQLRAERHGRRVEVDGLVTVRLDQRPAVARVGLVLERAAHFAEALLARLISS